MIGELRQVLLQEIADLFAGSLGVGASAFDEAVAVLMDDEDYRRGVGDENRLVSILLYVAVGVLVVIQSCSCHINQPPKYAGCGCFPHLYDTIIPH